MPKYIQIQIDQYRSIWVSENEAQKLINTLGSNGISSFQTNLASISLNPPHSEDIDNGILEFSQNIAKWASNYNSDNISHSRSATQLLDNLILKQLDALTLGITGKSRNVHDAIIVSKKLLSKQKLKAPYMGHPTGDTLESTLELARQIWGEVRGFIPLGGTAPELNLAQEELLQRPEGTQPSKDDLNNMSLIAESVARLNSMRMEGSTEDAIRTHRAGNCRERANQAFSFLKLRDLNIPGDVFAITTQPGKDPRQRGFHNGDHVFFVLNRSYPSDDNDPETWGEKAVICDPWSNLESSGIYPAYKYKEYMKNYYRDPNLMGATENVDLGPDGCHRLTVVDGTKVRQLITDCQRLLKEIHETKFGNNDLEMDQYIDKINKSLSSAKTKKDLEDILVDLNNIHKAVRDPIVNKVHDSIHILANKIFPSATQKAQEIQLNMGKIPLEDRKSILNSKSSEAEAVISAMSKTRGPFASKEARTIKDFKAFVEQIRRNQQEEEAPPVIQDSASLVKK